MSNILFDVSVQSVVQLNTVIQHNINKIYIPFDMIYSGEISQELITHIHDTTDISVYISLPEIIRKRDDDYLQSLKDFLMGGKPDGILVKNLEEIGFIKSISDDLCSQYISINGENKDFTPLYIEADYSLYAWNKHSAMFIKSYCDNICVPLELNYHEIKELGSNEFIIPMYGHAALMRSANCIRKTSGNCTGKPSMSFDYSLKDRKNANLPVFCNCFHCYNVIYNSVPTSNHKKLYDFIDSGFSEFRIDFTIEQASECTDILDFYIDKHGHGEPPVGEFTSYHMNKGAI